MHSDLDNWLEQVWGKRKDLIKASTDQGYMKGRGASAGMDRNDGVWEVYKMYNSISGGATSSDQAHLTAMRKWLVHLEDKTHMTPGVQTGSEIDHKELGWMATAADTDISDKFIHYTPGKVSSASYRIYINCKMHVCGEVFTKILVDHGLFAVPGLYSAKVATPGGATRADVIVIYMENESGLGKALDCVQSYHATAKGNFNSAMPKLITPSRGLQGVGTAMEPPSLRIVSTGGQFYRKKVAQSFGAYRSELIFMALERTRYPVPPQTDEQRKGAFKRRVEKYFRRAGIDPDNPALQRKVDDLPKLSSIENWSAMVDNGD